MSPGPGQTVGRSRELEELDARLEAVAAGAPACIALEGEPGIGKTRLLQELRERAEARGHIVLVGAAAEFERDMPFGVWVEALDAYVASQDPRLRKDFDDGLFHELGAVLPAVRKQGGEEHPAVPDERYRAHRAVRALLELLAGGEPLVVVLDDLHWADPGSVELIGSLLRRLPDAAVLLALAYRSGKAPAKLASSLASPEVARMKLVSLSERESAVLTGTELDPRRSAAIFAESGGNPFYALQLARAAELPSRRASGDRLTGVPDAVAATLIAELQALTPTARTLLAAGAIAGDPFEPELACAIGRLTEDAGLAALDELLEVALLQPTDVPRRFAFRHPLVRRAVYESATEGWRLGAHGRAAAALAARGASAAAQAHHVEQSAAHGDGAAIELLREAGDAAAPRSPAGAARWYAAALRLMPDAEREARLRVLIELAAAQRAVGDHENCCQSLLGAIELVAPDDVDLRVDLTARCAGSELFLGLHERAQRRLAEVSDALPDRGSRPAVVALLAQATAALFTSDHTRARDLAARALEHARSLRDPGLTGEAAATLAHAATIQGDIPLADSAQVEAATLLDSLADAALAAHLEAVHRFCRASLHLERYEDGVHHAQRGLRVALATGRGELVPVIKSSLAQCALMLGRLALATESQDAAIEGARLAGNDYVTCALLSTSANIASLKGDLEGALSAGEESVAIVAASAHGHILSVAKACLAVTMREAGSSRAHAEELVEPVGGWALTRLPAVWRVRHQEALTRIELGAGEVERAKECVRLAEAAAAELGMGVAKALAERARAAVLLASQEPVAAAELALASAAKADAAGARIEAASSRILAGRALAAAGERTRAIDLLREAEAELDDCGALSGRNHARRELRKLGARSEPRGPASGADSGLESLTAREREIAELVRMRKTNPEIAAQLYLSKKTVESHLRNIFMKLGASSRMEVALIVERARHEEEGAPVGR